MTSIRTNVLQKLDEILCNDKKSKNIEKSIYNWTITYIKNNLVEKVKTKKDKKKVVYVYNNTLSWDNTRFCNTYKQKTRSILFDLNNIKNPKFLEKVKSGEIKSTDIVNLPKEEIFPELWAPIFKKQNDSIKRSLKNQGLLFENAYEGIYQCSKCKCKKIDHYSLQTRSADEPMTIYFTCLNCMNRWKD